MKRVWSIVLAMVLVLTAMTAVFAEGETKYLQLQKTDTTGVMNYSMLKNLQGFLTAGYGSVTLRADMKIDKIEGADGMQLYRTGTWRDYGYLRQDGESGIKFVVKGQDATDANGASVPAETERKGLQLGEWYSYEFTFTMQEPYTMTLTVRQGDQTVVEPISWPDIAERGSFAWQLRTNTQVKMDVKNLKVIGKNAGTETVLEDRTYQETAEGNYYGGTTDAVGGVDNKTRTSKLIVLEIPDPPTPPAEEERRLELTKTDASSTDSSYAMFYYALKNLKSYADGIFDSITLKMELKIDSMPGEYADGIEIFRSGSWADYGYLRRDGETGLKYVIKGSGVQETSGEAAAAEYTGMALGEWVECEVSFGMKAPYRTKITLSDGAGNQYMQAIWPDIADRGDFGLGLRPNTVTGVSLRKMQVLGVRGNDTVEIEDRDFASAAAGAYTGGSADRIVGANGTTRTAEITGTAPEGQVYR